MEKDQKAAEVLRSGRAAWEAIDAQAGLTKSEQGRYGYDYDLVADVRRALVADASGELGELLDRHDVSVERVLAAFVRSAEPFARMMREILTMFEAASARSSDHNLRFALDFGDLGQRADFDLTAFRQEVETLERAVVLRTRRLWNTDNGWMLSQSIAKSALTKYSQVLGDLPSPRDQRIADWCSAMEPGHDFAPPPPPTPTGFRPFDELALGLWPDFEEFQQLGRLLYGICTPGFAMPAPEECAGWDPRFLQIGTSDFWPREQIHALALLADQIAGGPIGPDVARLVASLAERVDAITTPPQPVETMRRSVEDVLNLPAWRRRHELYAVWIAARITSHFDASQVRFHPVDGVLSFPFRATHLADIGASLQLWSELRHDAGPAPLGRKVAIQPDYELRFASDDPADHGATRMFIECKQYRRSSTRNFSNALNDYADARPGAIVVLANYGPVGAAVMRSVRSSVSFRCHAIGDVRPAGGGLGAFGRMLDPFVQAVPPAKIASGRDGWMLEHFAAELSWRRQGVDLDLHVATGTAACGYLTRQGLAEATFTRDDRGEGAPPFHEAIYVVPGDSDLFEVVVHAFAGSQTVAAADATVTLIYRTTSGVTFRKSVDLGSANGQAWHVASFARDMPEPMLRDRRADGFVAGSGWSF